MKRFIAVICTFGFCLALAGAALAQEEDENTLGRIYLVDVKDGHGNDFEEGIKAYFGCYGENGGKKPYSVWHSESGKLGRYAFTTFGHKWAAFDEMEEASQACSEIFQQQFLPHIEKAKSEFTSFMPEQSNFDEEKEYNVVWVIDFDVNSGHDFVGAVTRITEAAREAEWGNYAFYNVHAGGRHAGDFFVVILGEKFASFDEEEAGLWEMVAGVHGEEEAASLRETLNDSIDDDWAEIWRRDTELSYTPEGAE